MSIIYYLSVGVIFLFLIVFLFTLKNNFDCKKCTLSAITIIFATILSLQHPVYCVTSAIAIIVFHGIINKIFGDKK